ncbi:calcium-binding mitochondrial carrier protein SCaMC-3-like isoform X1 [Ischnura elegans]|uniref:calcium-binding mitochondrial carrier protein SCaMC-3-like isoform X1 n=1 Tax=Ischnura elegans TaxID=197161 RepID=UPI001ED881B9|nr:calcium-binding mitochondrial carrier protein SCaMC-3-like isoform X1 [Ischnura elegans]XP_046384073.1 calcium-binding mitochondrial carrier protein SCaMC-3-like isoform X1 [Ischnura elegans]
MGLSWADMMKYLVAGGIAGGVSRTVTAPVDRIKVFLQANSKYGGLLSCLHALIKEGGILGLWRGNAMNLIKTVPDSAIKFMVYEQAKAITVKSNSRELSLHHRVLAGSLAGCTSQAIIYPLESLKTRLTLRKTGQYSSILDAVVKITRKEGMRWYYRGFLPNILGVIPYSGIDLATYETIKLHYLLSHEDGQRPSLLYFGGSAAVSSSFGLIVTYPFALVKTRLQALEIPLEEKRVGKIKELTMIDVFREVIQREGVFGLYRGVLANLIKVIPAVCISYMINEKCRQSFGLKLL